MGNERLFQSLHHISIVVEDLDRSVAYYQSMGVGPWHDFPSLEPFTHELSGVEKPELLNSRYKYTTMGDVQLHLCQPAEGDSPQRRFLTEHGEAVFNLSFSVPDVNIADATAAEQGLAVLLRGRTVEGKGFTYFDTRTQGAGVVLQVRSAS